jgi:hypothetical protein
MTHTARPWGPEIRCHDRFGFSILPPPRAPVSQERAKFAMTPSAKSPARWGSCWTSKCNPTTGSDGFGPVLRRNDIDQPSLRDDGKSGAFGRACETTTQRGPRTGLTPAGPL